MINFGKHRGKTWDEVYESDRSYVEWAMDAMPHKIPAHIKSKAAQASEIEVTPNSFTEEQDAIVAAIKNKENVVVFGLPGTGKSFVIKSVTGSNVKTLAPTGVAALNIDGKTFHSFFAINPSDKLITVKKLFGLNSKSVLIFDEAFYTSPSMFFRVLEAIQIKFGKLPQMLFFGDPLQLEPVHSEKKAAGDEEVNEEEEELILELAEWKGKTLLDVLQHFNVEYKLFNLQHSQRHPNPETFAIMKAARMGKLTVEQLAKINRQVKTVNVLDDIFILTYRRSKARDYNQRYISHFKDTERIMLQAQMVQTKNDKFIEVKDIRTENISPDAMAMLLKKVQANKRKKKNIEVAIGCKVLIVKNGTGYVNGDRGTLVSVSEYSLTIELDRGGVVDVPLAQENTWTVNYPGNTIVLGWRQFPVTPAKAATVHKSQGITIHGRLHIEVDAHAFKHNNGLLYTALTRIKTLDQLSLSSSVNNGMFKYNKMWAAVIEGLKLN